MYTGPSNSFYSPMFYTFFLFFTILVSNVRCDGVLGCGGFVRSDVDINFSLVEVKLYTTHGSIKYQTDCAPKSGYYLIPLYEKGDFVLKVEPPAGWSFDPESVTLKVDGSTDRCSLGEDINFKFTGFSINGQVISNGQSTGPEGVKLELTKEGETEAIQTTSTGEEGSYSFTQVLPGKYEITATPSQNIVFQQVKTKVEVNTDNVNAGSSLVIFGYRVVGNVQSEGEPIKGVNFILFSKNFKPEDIGDCEKSALKGFTHSESSEPLCYVTSKEDGSFVYPALPVGHFSVMPFYKGEHIRFDVEPGKLSFEVNHAPVDLKDPFQVEGFSVSGKVLSAEKGAGVPNANIFINGKQVAKCEDDGTYHLENMKTGTYHLQVKTENIFFDDVSVKITPNTPQLPDIIATEFQLCGKILITKLPDSLRQVPRQRRVIFVPQTKNSDSSSVMVDADGSFCSKVKSGKHTVQVHLTEEEKAAGLLISPSEKTVTVNNAPILDITFSQFRAKVTGTVNCLEKCGTIEISLDAERRGEAKQTTQVKEAEKGGSFQFDNVMPGKYKVTLMQDSWCWKEKTVEIDVVNSDLAGIEFSQTGYILKCSISHEIKLHFAHDRKEGTVGSFQLNKGTNRFCLAQPGVYKLTPDSCHKFEKDVYTYDTSNPELLTLTAIKHLMEGTVTTEEAAGDITVTIVSLVDKTPVTIKPSEVKPKAQADAKDDQTKTTKQAAGPFVYKFSHWARSSERLEVSVKSKELLFSPHKIDVMILGDSCAGEVAKFTGKRGVFINGQIKPALAGVNIQVAALDDSMDPITLETTESGKFSVGPLHSGHDYDVTAEKSGYVLVKDKTIPAHFQAFKLGEVSVQVIQEDAQPLSNVLLSLSGEHQYRSNNVTSDNGTIVFTSLSPGQYFLRPMMKEYRFDPASQTIDVLEGSTKKIVIKGVRVAFSCYGMVTSLNGEPEQGVVVEAVGQGECHMYQEESKTEQDGSYRIRGLQPKCDYEVRLKSDVNKHIERAAPASRSIYVKDADFTEVNVIAFRRMNQMDVSGNVITNEDYLTSLKVRLFRDDNPDSPIHTSSLGMVTFFFLPSLPIDSEKYTLKLESSLSKASYEFTLPEVSFTANVSYRHFTLRFKPMRKSLEQELAQGTPLILPFSILVAVAIYNYQKLLPIALQILTVVQAALAAKRQGSDSSPSGGGGDTSAFDSDVPVPKKKVKARKM